MYKLGYDKLSASAWKLHQRVKGLGVKPAAGTDWRWLGKQMNTGGTMRPGGPKVPKIKSLQDIGGGTPRFRAVAKQTPNIEVGEVQQGKGAPHVIRGGELLVPLGSGVAMYGRQQAMNPLRAVRLMRYRNARDKMTTHSHPSEKDPANYTKIKQKAVGDTVQQYRDIASIYDRASPNLRVRPHEAPRSRGIADRIEAAAKRNVNIVPSGADMSFYEDAPGWHGIIDPTSGETLHIRAGFNQKPKMIQSYQAMPEPDASIHPPFEANTNPTFRQMDTESKAHLDRELRKMKGWGLGRLLSWFRGNG